MTAREQEILRGMSEREIRRAQALVRAQIPMAFEQGNTSALEQLHEWEDDYAAELCRRISRVQTVPLTARGGAA